VGDGLLVVMDRTTPYVATGAVPSMSGLGADEVADLRSRWETWWAKHHPAREPRSTARS
jgi:hypothetical protein